MKPNPTTKFGWAVFDHRDALIKAGFPNSTICTWEAGAVPLCGDNPERIEKLADIIGWDVKDVPCYSRKPVSWGAKI